MAPESRAQLYRRKAAEARQAAEKLVNNSTLKTGYLEVAQAWLELAEQAERSDDLVQQQQQQQQQKRIEPDDESDEKD